MIVFKTFMKLVRRNFSRVLIFIVIFSTMSAILTLSYRSKDTDFEEKTYKMGLVNKDKSKYTAQLLEHIEESNNKYELLDSEEELKDKVFKKVYDIGIVLNEGDMEKAIKGDQQLNTIVEGSSKTGSLAFTDINKYLLYMAASEKGGNSIDYANTIIENKAEVEMLSVTKNAENWYYDFFKVTSYLILSVILGGASFVMADFNEENMQKRSNISSTSLKSYITQLELGQFILSLILVFMPIIFSLLISPARIDSTKLFYLIVNVIALILCGMGLAFLVNALTTNKNITLILMNLIPLGLSFISGVFMPLEFVGKTAIQIAKFAPVYYYVMGIEKIVMEGKYPYINNLYILLFGVLFTVAGLYIKNRKFQKSN